MSKVQMSKEVLLSYEMNSTPQPLFTNQKGIASVTLKPPDNKVSCKELKIHIPVGTAGQALFQQANAISVTLIQEEEAWKTVLSKEREAESYKTIILSNQLFEGQAEEGDTLPVEVRLEGQVSGIRGAFEVQIEESSCRVGDSLSWKETSLTGAKEPEGLYCENLYAQTKDKKYITEVECGEDITLRWEANGKNYTVYYGGEKKETTDTWLEIKGGICRDTGFMLVAADGSQKSICYMGLQIIRPDIFGGAVQLFDGDLLVYTETFVPDADGMLTGTAVCQDKNIKGEISLLVSVGTRTWQTKAAACDAKLMPAVLTVPVYRGQEVTLFHDGMNYGGKGHVAWEYVPIGRESKLRK